MNRWFVKLILAMIVIGIIGAMAFGHVTIYGVIEDWSPMWATYGP